MAKYQNTSNLENHYVTAGTDHKELADRLTSMQHIDRQARLGSAADGRIAVSRTSSQVVYLHAIGPKVQEVQLLANTQVR